MTTITARPVATASVATATPSVSATTTSASTSVASSGPQRVIDGLDGRFAPRADGARPSTAPALPAVPPNANSASIYAAETPAAPAQTALAAALAAQLDARKEDNADGTTTLWSPAVDGLSRGVRFSAEGERLGPVRSGRSH